MRIAGRYAFPIWYTANALCRLGAALDCARRPASLNAPLPAPYAGIDPITSAHVSSKLISLWDKVSTLLQNKKGRLVLNAHRIEKVLSTAAKAAPAQLWE
jgi:hypothetical protein